MILNFIIAIITHVISFIFDYLPDALLIDIPLVGQSINDVLVYAVTTWNVFSATFPYVDALWQVFLYIIIPFELATLLLRLIFGNRTPITH